MKEIEQDGYITRDADLTGQKRTCSNCEHYVYSLFLKCYVCSEGHSVSENDWRQKYNVCDCWRVKR